MVHGFGKGLIQWYVGVGGGGRALKLCNLITGFLGYGNPMFKRTPEISACLAQVL